MLSTRTKLSDLLSLGALLAQRVGNMTNQRIMGCVIYRTKLTDQFSMQALIAQRVEHMTVIRNLFVRFLFLATIAFAFVVVIIYCNM